MFQVLEVSHDADALEGVEVPRAGRRAVRELHRPVFRGADDERGSQSLFVGRCETSVVGCDEHYLAGFQAERRDVAEIGLGERLVGARSLGAQNHVEWQAAVSGQVGQQGGVAVR